MQTHTNTDEILMLSFVTERLFLSPVMFWPPDIVYRNQLVDLNDKWVIELDGTKMELCRVLAFLGGEIKDEFQKSRVTERENQSWGTHGEERRA